MKSQFARALIEIGFIMFLFYANLLMGEFERSGAALGKGFIWAIGDILTRTNFCIGLIAAFVGYVCAEFLRRKL